MRSEEEVSLQALATQGVSLVMVQRVPQKWPSVGGFRISRGPCAHAPQYRPLQVLAPPTLSSRALISAGMSSTRGLVQET